MFFGLPETCRGSATPSRYGALPDGKLCECCLLFSTNAVEHHTPRNGKALAHMYVRKHLIGTSFYGTVLLYI
jgi:hypothetical protein